MSLDPATAARPPLKGREIIVAVCGGIAAYKVADVVSKQPEVEALMASVGGATASTLGGPNFGELMVHLKPRHLRDKNVDQIIRELRPKLTAIPGMKVYLQNPPTNPFIVVWPSL